MIKLKEKKIFIKLNEDELTGFNKILVFFKIKFKINKINYTKMSRIKGSLKNIYPINSPIKDFNDKYFLETKEYLFILDNIDQVNGCIFALQLLNRQDEIISLSFDGRKLDIPNIYLENKLIE